MGESFGVRLRAASAANGPLCAGVDPHPGLLAAWGLPHSLAGIERFAATCVEAFAGNVAVVKPQSAFFEVFGSAGVAVLERVLTDLRAAGTLTILDAKRGDIGTTMDAYAEAFLGPQAAAPADALTVSPYLGYGALRPAIDLAAAQGRGVFVLVLTSNPEGTSALSSGPPWAQPLPNLTLISPPAVRRFSRPASAPREPPPKTYDASLGQRCPTFSPALPGASSPPART